MSSSFRFALRLDACPSVVAGLGPWLASVSSSHLVCLENHDGENEHYHCYFVSDLKLKSVRQNLVRKFEIAGNGAYSFKECDANYVEYLKYMCKGPSEDELPTITHRCGLDWTDDYVQELHDAYWVRASELAAGSKRRIDLAAGGTIIEQVEREAKRLGLTGDDRAAIARVYLQLYLPAKKGVSVYHGKSVVNTVCALLSDHQYDVLAGEIASIGRV